MDRSILQQAIGSNLEAVTSDFPNWNVLLLIFIFLTFISMLSSLLRTASIRGHYRSY